MSAKTDEAEGAGEGYVAPGPRIDRYGRVILDTSLFSAGMRPVTEAEIRAAFPNAS